MTVLRLGSDAHLETCIPRKLWIEVLSNRKKKNIFNNANKAHLGETPYFQKDKPTPKSSRGTDIKVGNK